jgi:hypothetical protein
VRNISEVLSHRLLSEAEIENLARQDFFDGGDQMFINRPGSAKPQPNETRREKCRIGEKFLPSHETVAKPFMV